VDVQLIVQWHWKG